MQSLFDSARRERARRAEELQRAYQTAKANKIADCAEEHFTHFAAYADSVRRRIESCRPIDPQAQVLEVGSGAHGLIFFLGLPNAVGVDPLADIYPALFPKWQHRAKTLRAYGENLPFASASFDLVLSDNVIDHAERPEAVLTEIVRVLRPGGILYFTVDVHDPIYAFASRLHGALRAVGVRRELVPFAEHTTHFTLSRIRSRLRRLPLRVLHEDTGIGAARERARSAAPTRLRRRFRRMFFYGARFEIVAERV